MSKMKPLSTEEKMQGIANAMKAGADSVVDGKLDGELLRENLRKLLRQNSQKKEVPGETDADSQNQP